MKEQKMSGRKKCLPLLQPHQYATQTRIWAHQKKRCPIWYKSVCPCTTSHGQENKHCVSSANKDICLTGWKRFGWATSGGREPYNFKQTYWKWCITHELRRGSQHRAGWQIVSGARMTEFKRQGGLINTEVVLEWDREATMMSFNDEEGDIEMKRQVCHGKNKWMNCSHIFCTYTYNNTMAQQKNIFDPQNTKSLFLVRAVSRWWVKFIFWVNYPFKKQRDKYNNFS